MRARRPGTQKVSTEGRLNWGYNFFSWLFSADTDTDRPSTNSSDCSGCASDLAACNRDRDLACEIDADQVSTCALASAHQEAEAMRECFLRQARLAKADPHRACERFVFV